MQSSVRAPLATQPDSASLENLAMLADRAVAAEKDVDEAKPGVAEINVTEIGKLIGLLEDLSRRLKKLATATARKRHMDTHNQPRTVPPRHNSSRMFKQNLSYLIIKLLLGKIYQIIEKNN